MDLLQSVQVQFSFIQLLSPAYTSRYLQAPSGVVGVTFRDFNLLHLSFLKWFRLFIWLLFAVSSVSNFRPDTGGRRWSLIQVRQFSSVRLQGGRGAAHRYRCVWMALAVFRPHWVCPIQGCLCFPRLHCSGSQLLYNGAGPALSGFQFSGPPQKRGFGCACILCLPRPERLRQPEAWAPSPRARRASSLRGPSAPQVGSQEVFRQEPGPVCRVGGGGFSGAEFAPFPSPCLLPPAGLGRLFSGVSQSLCFANRWRCVPAG